MSKKIKSILKNSEELREALRKRWYKKLGRRPFTEVEKDAAKYGRPDIKRPMISKYVNDPYAAGALNEDQIMWLATRWQIYVHVVIGSLSKKIKPRIAPYNEVEALMKLREIYPNETEENTQGTQD